ncbi:MAG: hypothetical protein PSX81_10665 [bacterium]|nr:hypothetical protein [bacterium]
MQTTSLSGIKKELQTLPQEQLVELCARMAKYKKENKELLHYILFESGNEELYIENIKAEVEGLFEEITTRNYYLAKKSIRKILRSVTKYIKYSGNPQTSAELLIHFCVRLNGLGLDFHGSTALLNLYDGQIKKIRKSIASMHEDLQYDFIKLLEKQLNIY